MRVVILSVVSEVRLVREVSSRRRWCATWIEITWLKCREGIRCSHGDTEDGRKGRTAESASDKDLI